jgi:hypothetical protein
MIDRRMVVDMVVVVVVVGSMEQVDERLAIGFVVSIGIVVVVRPFKCL